MGAKHPKGILKLHHDLYLDDLADGSQNIAVFYEAPLVLPPEKKLFLQIIKNALLERSRRDLQWINGEAEGYVTFEFICEVFGVSVTAARKALASRFTFNRKTKEEHAAAYYRRNVEKIKSVKAAYKREQREAYMRERRRLRLKKP